MWKDEVKARGTVSIKLTGPDGEVKDERSFPNLVVTVGHTWIAARMGPSGSIPADMGWIAVGTGTNAPAPGDTTLQTEIARVAMSVSGGAPSGSTTTYTATLNPGTGTGAITEAGIFNAAGANSGTMLAHTEFAAINKGALDTLTVSWAVTNS
jgi:hypothetical protein